MKDVSLEKSMCAAHVLVGFNEVNRHLEALSTVSAAKNGINTTKVTPEDEENNKSPHIAAVFLLRPLDDLIYAHLPTLCYTASLAHLDLPKTRLVLLDPAVQPKVAQALGGSASVSMLAVTEFVEGKEASELQSLIQYVREHVDAPEAGWLKKAMNAKWLGTKIDVQ